MRKIPTVLVRDPENRARVLDEVSPGCEWVLAGEGVATRKYDGTCTMLDGEGRWWARREVKPGKTPPPNFVPDNTDLVTGKTQGWEPIEQSSFARFHAEANIVGSFEPGTYELVGPRINGNPERLTCHSLIEHATAERIETRVPHSVAEVKALVGRAGMFGWEGVVWHHPDGRMAKLKVRDLGWGASV